MTTGESLRGSASVRKLQTVLHAKAKEEPGRRFHALVDKVWREDFLLAAWGMVRRNGGAAGVDGVTVADIGAHGVKRWVGELSRDLREGTYAPSPVRQVLIPKRQPGKFRPLGIPCLRDRVAQTSAMLVLSPIFEADLEPEQYGYRPGRSAKDAVRRIHRLLHTGRNEVIDADLSNYFGEIPHAELSKECCTARERRADARTRQGVAGDAGSRGGRGGRRAPHEPGAEGEKGTPQGAPISPLLSNIYMRRFILGWKVLGHARRFSAEIVTYADDFCVLGEAPAAEMLAAVNWLMERLKLPVNARKTRCLRCPEEPIEFLGYRIGWNYRPTDGGRYIGTRPSKASVQSICCRISEETIRGRGWLEAEEVVGRLNRMISGWANYFDLGQVSPAYAAVDRHAIRRLRQWLRRKHKVRSGRYVRFSDERLWHRYGLARLGPTTGDLPWAKA